jgi:hypothetical protein
MHESEVLPGFEIPTRQKGDLLFQRDEPITTPSTIRLPIRLVAGYAAIAFFGVSDAPFDVRPREACSENGPFVQTGSFSSSLVGSDQRACERVFQCGTHMEIDLVRTGAPQTRLSFCAIGIPMP